MQGESENQRSNRGFAVTPIGTQLGLMQALEGVIRGPFGQVVAREQGPWR